MSAIPKPEKRIRDRKRISRTSKPRKVSNRRAAAARRKADREWSAAVKERAGGWCELCPVGVDAGLDAHHVVSRRFKATRHHLGNGVFLSRECHRWAHKHQVWFRSWYECAFVDRWESLAKQEAN